MSRFVGQLRIRALSPDEVRRNGGGRTGLFEVVEDFTFVSDKWGPIICPVGMITDFASIPALARFYINDDSPNILFPSLPHDRTYSLGGRISDTVQMTRDDADDMIVDGMRVCGATRVQCFIVRNALRIGGGSHWGNPT